MACEAIRFPIADQRLPERGVYLLSEESEHLYAGRSDHLRARLNTHQRESSTVNQATFAAEIARRECGIKRNYGKKQPGKAYWDTPRFKQSFSAAKKRIRVMDIRIVEETDPVRQALLEIYVAVILHSRFNDFANH